MLRKLPWIAAILLFFTTPFLTALFPEQGWLSWVLFGLLAADLLYLIWHYRKNFHARTTAHGLYSVVMAVLVLGLLITVNIIGDKHQAKFDATAKKVHTLSKHTVKLVEGIKVPVFAELYGTQAEREKFKTLLDNYSELNPKFEVEFVDANKEVTRVRAAGIKKAGTLVLRYGEKSSKVEDLNEENVTNALIKLMKDKDTTFCVAIGHDEKDFNSEKGDGYKAVKLELEGQSYQVKQVNLFEVTEVPKDCSALALIGPKKAIPNNSIAALNRYLENGGRMIVAIDIDLQRASLPSEVVAFLAKWHINVEKGVTVDPLSRSIGVDAFTPLVSGFSHSHPITKEFQSNSPSLFPVVAPLKGGSSLPEGATLEAIAKTTPGAWGETDFQGLTKGRASRDPSDIKGPITVAYALEQKNKDSKTRLVAFGSSHFAINANYRYGRNLDLFMNSAAWVLEDDSMISIRSKDDDPGKLELTVQQNKMIWWGSVVFAPCLIAGIGGANWLRRRRM